MIDTKSDTKNDTESLVIYPAKSEIGMMSKTYLELINNKIRKKDRSIYGTTLNQF